MEGPKSTTDSQPSRAGSALDLSRYNHLRTLELPERIFTNPGAFDFLNAVLSTAASPLPFQVVIVYDYKQFNLGMRYHRTLSSVSEPGGECLACQQLATGEYETLDQIRKTWNFRPVYCVEGVGPEVEDEVRLLEHMLEERKKKSDSPLPESLVFSRMRCI